MTGLEKVLTYYNRVQADSMQAAIVRNILIHLKDLENMTIYDLAEACYTSPASISRLVRRMGCRNYSYFQKELVDSVRRYGMHNRLTDLEKKPEDIDLADYYFDTFEGLFHKMRKELDREKVGELTEMFHNSEKIAIYTYSTFMSELFLQSDLFMAGHICDIHSLEQEIIEHVKVLTERDSVLMMAPSCIEGVQAEKIIRLVHLKGARICMLTDSKRAEGLKKADIGIVIPGVMQAVDMYVMQLFLSIVDLEYRRRYLDIE